MNNIYLDNYITKKIPNFSNEDENYNKPNSLIDWYTEWDFSGFNSNIYNHGLHQYPARFIPQLARKLIRTFADKDSTVLDIFSGSGTTLLECKYLGIKKAYGIELNPFAVFMAKTKLDNISYEETKSYFKKIENNYFDEAFNYNDIYFDNISFWYNSKTIKELSKLLASVKEIPDEKIRNFYLLAFCDITRKTSYLDYSGFKMYRSPKKKNNALYNPDVFGEYKKNVERNLDLLFHNNEINKNLNTEQKLILGDSRVIHNEILNNSVDFILTSPPYGDSHTTVAYGQYSRLPWLWLSGSKDIIKLDNNLLGGSTKNLDIEDISIFEYSKTLEEQVEIIKNVDSSNRFKEVIAFYKDLYSTLVCAFSYLKKDHYFVLVTGNRTVKKVYLRTDKIISEFGKNIGFSTEAILSRNILNKRMARKNSPTNKVGETVNTMTTENIIILKKV